MYCTTYEKFGGAFFRFGNIWPLLTINKVKYRKFWLIPENKNHLLTIDKNFCFNEKSQNSSFLTMPKVKMGHILPKRKNTPPNILYVVQYMANYQKINRKLKKYWGQINSFLPLTQNWKSTLRPFCNQLKNSFVL